MAYTNKYILKADIADLEQKLKSAEVSYTEAMDAMGESSKKLTLAEEASNKASAKHLELQKQHVASAQSIGTAAAKKQYGEKLKLAALQEKAAKKEVADLTRVNNSRKRNVQTINESIGATKREIAGKQKLLTTMTATTAATNSSSKANAVHAASLKQMSNDVVRHIRHLESYLVALYAIKKGYEATLGVGHEFNKLIERETIGMKLLISQNLEDVDSKGKQLTALEKYTLAQHEATKAIKLAREVNLKTPHSFAETLQIFKLLTPQVLQYGGTLEDVAQITQRMSVVAQSMGIEYQQFLKTVDSALSGEMKESGLKRALAMFGVTNEGIKEIKERNGDVVAYVIKGLKQADAAGLDVFGSWAGVMGQFKNEWDELWGELQKPLFNTMKVEIKDLTIFLKENKEEIIATVKAVTELALVALKLATAYTGVKAIILLTNTAQKAWIKLMAISKAAMVAHITLEGAYAKAKAKSLLVNQRFGKSTTASTFLFRGMSAALGPVAIATVAAYSAFELWTTHTENQEEALEALKNTINQTQVEIAKLSKVEMDISVAALAESLAESEEKIAEYKAALKKLNSGQEVGLLTAGASALSYRERMTLSLKEQQVLLMKRLGVEEKLRDSILKQQVAIAELDPALKRAVDQQGRLQSNIDYTTRSILKTKLEIAAADEDEKAALAEMLKAQQAALEKLQDSKGEADRLVDSLANASQSIYKSSEGATALSAGLKDAADHAEKMQLALLASDKLRGKIGEESYLEKKFDIDSRSAYDEGDLGKVALLRQKYEDSLYKLRQKNEKSLNTDVLANLQAHGQKREVLALKIKAIDESKLPDAQKLLQIDTLRKVYADSIAKDSAKAGKGYEKTLQEMEAAFDRLYEATHTIEEVSFKVLGDELAELGKYLTQSELSQIYKSELEKMQEANEEFLSEFDLEAPSIISEVFDPYVSLSKSQKKYEKDLKKAGKDADKRNKISSKFVSDQIRGYAGMANGIQGFFKEGTTGYEALGVAQQVLQAAEFAWYIKKELLDNESLISRLVNIGADTTATVASETVKGVAIGTNAVLTQGQGDPYTAFARMAAMAAVVAGLGVALKGGISGGSSSSYTPTYAQFSSGMSGDTSQDVNRTVNLDADGVRMGLDDYNAILKLAAANQMSFNKTMEAYIDLQAEASQIWETAREALSKWDKGLTDYAEALDITYDIGSFDELNEFFDNSASSADKLAFLNREATYFANLAGYEMPLSIAETTAQLQYLIASLDATTDATARAAIVTQINNLAKMGNATATYVDEMDSVATSCSNAAEDMQRAAESMRMGTAELQAAWGDSDVEGAKLILAAAVANTGLSGLTYDNFLASFNSASQAGLTEDALADWEVMSDALMNLEDAMAELDATLQDQAQAQIDLAKEELSFYQDLLSTIESAYTGSLSYLTSVQQQDYLAQRADVYRASGDDTSYLKTLEAQLAVDKKVSVTREEYAIDFNRYVRELQDQEPEKTTDDVVESIDSLAVKIEEYADAIERASFQG